MYLRIPSFTSLLEAANIRSAIDTSSTWGYQDTITLLSSPVPLPLSPSPSIPNRSPRIRWAPLPARPVRGKKGSWARSVIREPALESMVKSPRGRSSEGVMRKYTPSETMAVVRKWYRKGADVGRSRELSAVDRYREADAVRGRSKGVCHYCEGCGESHEMARNMSAVRGERVR
ncbi:MAG: hypothetical protein Q9215_006450 [Flavoplaca cf. flavocitrina]